MRTKEELKELYREQIKLNGVGYIDRAYSFLSSVTEKEEFKSMIEPALYELAVEYKYIMKKREWNPEEYIESVLAEKENQTKNN